MITRRSDDAAVILDEIHMPGPPTSWNWLIIYTLALAVSASRFYIRQKNSGRTVRRLIREVRFRDYREFVALGDFSLLRPSRPLFFSFSYRRVDRYVSGSTNWS